MSLASTILTAIGYRLDETITATSEYPLASILQYLNETALWITGICAENDSDLGRTTGTITTLYPAISAATQASPCAVTSAVHGLVDNDEIVIKGVSGMTDLNDHEYTFTKTSTVAGTLGVDSSDYGEYTSGGYMSKRKYSDLATVMYVPCQQGWLVKDYSRDPIDLISEKSLLDYNPVETTEPASFYVDGANNICFPSYPDDVYTIKIPYWTLPTALTDSGDTMPFLGLMDNVFIEAVTIRALNRDEYDLTTELKWLSFLNERVLRVIAMRKRMGVSVGT